MPATQTVRDAIEECGRHFAAIYGTGDASQLAQLYTPDAQLLPAGTDAVVGPQAIEQFWQGAMDMGIKSVELELLEVEGSSDLVYEVGRYSLAAADGSVLDRGKYVVIWKQDGESWKVHRDMWTTNIK